MLENYSYIYDVIRKLLKLHIPPERHAFYDCIGMLIPMQRHAIPL